MKLSKYLFLILSLQLASFNCFALAPKIIDPEASNISVTISQHYNKILRIKLPMIVIHSTKSIHIDNIIINLGVCKINKKYRHLLPQTLLAEHKLEIRFMLGCQVNEIALLLTVNEKTVIKKFMFGAQVYKYILNGKHELSNASRCLSFSTLAHLAISSKDMFTKAFLGILLSTSFALV